MTGMAMTEVSMERCLVDMPYEILYEIFRRLPKNKLFKISGFSSKFENVVKDTRLWKDVYIKYEPVEQPESNSVIENLAFEELYSGPSPVKVIEVSCMKIEPPVFSKTDQVVKVKKLKLTSIVANVLTMETILAKYQCTELYLGYYTNALLRVDLEIAPEAFSKQTALEVLSLRTILEGHTFLGRPLRRWLPIVLSNYCMNLKTLDLNYTSLIDFDLAFIKSLPASLEKLFLISSTCPENKFFKDLAEQIPNLKELALPVPTAKYPSLLEFKFLEALHVASDRDFCDLYKYLIRFPALKNVYCILISPNVSLEGNVGMLRKALETHGITIIRITEDPELSYPKDNNLWVVTKTM